LTGELELDLIDSLWRWMFFKCLWPAKCCSKGIGPEHTKSSQLLHLKLPSGKTTTWEKYNLFNSDF
jgi:hypothetical protein